MRTRRFRAFALDSKVRRHWHFSYGGILIRLGLQLQQQELEKKNQDLVNHFRDKSKKHQKLLGEFQKIKQQQFAAGIESAADHEADDVLQAAATVGHNPHQHRHGQPMPSRAGSNGSGGRHPQGNTWPNQAQGGRIYTARTYINAQLEMF